jgi:hypothetical protein
LRDPDFFYLIYRRLEMSLKVLRKWLPAFMLTVGLFVLAACNGSGGSGSGTPPPVFPAEALSEIGIDIAAPDGGNIESVKNSAGSIEVVWNSVPETAIDSFFADMVTELGTPSDTQDDADAKVARWEHTNGGADYVVNVTHNRETGKLILNVNPRPAFPASALSDMGIEIAKPAGLKIEDVQNDEAGTIEVYWIGVTAAAADGFMDSMAAALEKAGATPRDDADAKIVTWDHTGDVEYEVTVTFVRQNHDLNGTAVKAGDMILNIKPKNQVPDLELDDTIRRVAAYIAFDSRYYNTYKLGIIEGNSDVNSLSVDARVDTMPPVQGIDAQQAKVFAYGNRPKDGSATVVLERYYYDLTAGTSLSAFSTFDANGAIDESTIAANAKNWGSVSNPNYAANARNTVRVGNYLYIISYDVPRISKINLSTGLLVSSAEMDPIPGFSVKGQDIVVAKGRIFALFTVPDSAYPPNYQDSIVVEVKHTDNDRPPTFGDNVSTGKNAVNMVSVDDYIYVPSVGGGQHDLESNGAESRIDRITLSGSGITAAPVYYVDDDYDFHGLIIGKEKTLILRVMLDNDIFTTWAYLTSVDTADLHTVSNQAVSTIPAANNIIDEEMQRGYAYSMVYDDVFNHFWFATTGKLTVYNSDLSDFKEFSMRDELYGVTVGAIESIALFTGELGSARVSGTYIPHAVRSGLFSTPEEYYRSLK